MRTEYKCNKLFYKLVVFVIYTGTSANINQRTLHVTKKLVNISSVCT